MSEAPLYLVVGLGESVDAVAPRDPAPPGRRLLRALRVIHVF